MKPMGNVPQNPVPSPSAERKMEAVISTFRLERPLAALPRALRFALARKRYGWIDSMAALQHTPQDKRSLIETERLNAIFVHIPKAAGVSVAESLFASHAASHAPLHIYLSLYGSRRFNRMFKFTFVRHPLDRLVSAFQFLKAGGMTPADTDWAAKNLAGYDSLDAFICEGLVQPHVQDWVHFKQQVFYLRDPRSGSIGVDYMGRFETIGDDFAHIARMLNVEAKLKHVNKTAREKVTVSPQAQRVIEDVYKDDFEILGY